MINPTHEHISILSTISILSHITQSNDYHVSKEKQAVLVFRVSKGWNTGSTIRTLLPKDWQVLSLADVGLFFRVVSGDYGKPEIPCPVMWGLFQNQWNKDHRIPLKNKNNQDGPWKVSEFFLVFVAHVLRHWYSNVGGSIVKMGDSDIHMPIKTTDKKHKAQKTEKTPPPPKKKRSWQFFVNFFWDGVFLMRPWKEQGFWWPPI